MIPRSRFAPSPTGLLHVGGARTALFAYLYARSRSGRFVLRIEDTDRARSTVASEQAIREDLRWLGIVPDEGPEAGGPGAPYRQSERLARYDAEIQRLLDGGLAYLAWETPDELRALREAAGKGGFKYRRRPDGPSTDGRTPVVRFAVPADRDTIGFSDDILGPIEVDIDEVDDFVIKKADGFPTYHFAVVVDDHHMLITQVLRAQEHLKNTLKHRLLYEALGWDEGFPGHGHMPIIFSMSGGKMSKRDKAKAARAAAREAGLDAAALAARTGLDEETARRFLKKRTDEVTIALAVSDALGCELPEIDVEDFRRAGYLPEALVNFLALLGWNPGVRDEEGKEREIFSLEEMEQLFSLDRVGKTAARFDRDKLRWMNGQYIRAAGIDRLVEALEDWLGRNADSVLHSASAERRRELLLLFQERLSTLGELETSASYFFTAPSQWGPAKAVKKHLLKGDGLQRLAHAGEVLAGAEWTEAGLEAALNAAAQERHEGRLGKLAQPIRIAVTGGPVSPPIYGTLVGIGRDESLARVRACLEHFGG